MNHLTQGIAISDSKQVIAFPLETVLTADLLPFLRNCVAQDAIDTIVVGWPVRLDGSRSDTTQQVARFIRFLVHCFPQIPMLHYDERFTSAMAAESLITAGVKRKKRCDKTRLYTISATLILQSFWCPRTYTSTAIGYGKAITR